MSRYLVFASLLFCAGCASYRMPGAALPLAQLERSDAGDLLEQHPSPQLPVRLGIVRVQAADYRSASARGLASGRYSVLAQESLDRQQIQALANWPSVSGVAPLDPALLPAHLDSGEALRLAAAKMQADVLLVYSIDTQLQLHGQPVPPQAAVSLREPPADGDTISALATLRFIDVRTGYVYGESQATVQADRLAQDWTSAEALDGRRLAVERQAVVALLQRAEQVWGGIVDRYL